MAEFECRPMEVMPSSSFLLQISIERFDRRSRVRKSVFEPLKTMAKNAFAQPILLPIEPSPGGESPDLEFFSALENADAVQTIIPAIAVARARNRGA